MVRRYYNYFFSSRRNLARRLRPILGFVPSNMDLFQQAFFHKSNHHNTKANKGIKFNNERLEYLGDAILSTIVAEYLFKKYPSSNEGFLTKMRAKIVKRKTLNLIGDKMGLDVILIEYNNNTRLSKSMMGNALEALVGAVYLEKGYDATKLFVISRILREYLDVHELEKRDDNFKSRLLEWCQKNGKDISYEVIDYYKMDKRDRFKVAVLVDGDQVAEAEDYNKKSAEQSASQLALGILLNEMDGEDV
ncbi:MAG: ribonuclease III [Saprospiraceae bacterium]|nr:ribonuclease III [Saprospiraceae bacterium]